MTEIRPARAADALCLAGQRPESRLFYEEIAYQRTATSHVYHKQV